MKIIEIIIKLYQFNTLVFFACVGHKRNVQ